jgi:hypothetical protein
MSVEEKLRAERGAKYGPVRQNHRSIGLIWTGILIQAGWTPPSSEPTLPPEKVTLMMTGVKLSREAYQHLPDNIHDGKNYLSFAGELSEEDEDANEVEPAAPAPAGPDDVQGGQREPDESYCFACERVIVGDDSPRQHAYHCPFHR